jgi:hypothetical protein
LDKLGFLRYIIVQKILWGIYPEALCEQGAITIIIYIWKGILDSGQVVGQTALKLTIPTVGVARLSALPPLRLFRVGCLKESRSTRIVLRCSVEQE